MQKKHLGTLYIPPLKSQSPENNLNQQQQQLLTQETPPWMAKRTVDKDVPEWVYRAETNSYSPPQFNSNNAFSLNNNVNTKNTNNNVNSQNNNNGNTSNRPKVRVRYIIAL